MIQNARMKRKRRDSDDGDGSADGDEDLPEVTILRTTSGEDLILFHVNNKGADQPKHLRSLVSTFVVCFRERVI